MTPLWVALGIAAVCILLLLFEFALWSSNQRY
jgi:hypothetical protein